MPRAVFVALARHSLRHQRCATAASLFHRPFVPARPFNMSATTQYASSSRDDANEEDAITVTAKCQQGLPAPGEGTPITLDVSGEGTSVKLSDLGPLVVNVDGTVARISNWKEMTDAERETTVRMVGRRNKQRLDALKKRKEEAEGSGAGA